MNRAIEPAEAGPMAAAGNRRLLSSEILATPAVALVCAWLLLSLVRSAAGILIRQPQIFVDELVFWQMSRSFHESGTFLFLGHFYNIPSVLYPMLLSPVFGLADRSLSFDLARVANGALMSAVVFPAYTFGRELLDRRRSILVAVLAGLVPGGAYSALFMNENVFYPAFVLCAWLSFRVLAAPSWRSQIALAASFPLAFFAKPHVMTLLMAYSIVAAGLLLTGVDGPTLASRLRAAAARLVPLAGLVLIVPVRFLFDPHGPARVGWKPFLIGEHYSVLLQPAGREAGALALAKPVWSHFVTLGLSVAFIPLAAMIVLAFRMHRLPRRLAILTVLGTLSTVFLLGMAARQTVLNDLAIRTQERYVFVVAPVLFVLWLAAPRGESRAVRLVGTGIAIAFVLTLALGIPPLMTYDVNSGAPSLTGLFLLYLSTGGLWVPVAAAIALAVLCAFGIGDTVRGFVRAYAAVALVLCVLNAGWYAFWIRFGNNERGKGFAQTVNARLATGVRVALVKDDLDRHVVWAMQFWLDHPLFLYGVSDEARAWPVDGGGPIEKVSEVSNGRLLLRRCSPQAVVHELPPLVREDGVSTPICAFPMNASIMK